VSPSQVKFFYNSRWSSTLTFLTAYALDVFPDHSVESAALSNVFRVDGGFIVNYSQLDWAEAIGPQNTLGTEASIVAAGYTLVMMVQIFGRRWRTRFLFPILTPK
jgi:hypothetical protein